MAKTKYNSNATMEILGQQYNYTLVAPHGVAFDDFNNTLKGQNPTSTLTELCVDMFSLGMLYGIKAERAKRHNAELEPLTKREV